MGTTMRDKGTLEFALRPYRVDWSVLEEKHAAVLGMMEIILGWYHTDMFVVTAVLVRVPDKCRWVKTFVPTLLLGLRLCESISSVAPCTCAAALHSSSVLMLILLPHPRGQWNERPGSLSALA